MVVEVVVFVGGSISTLVVVNVGRVFLVRGIPRIFRDFNVSASAWSGAARTRPPSSSESPSNAANKKSFTPSDDETEGWLVRMSVLSLWAGSTHAGLVDLEAFYPSLVSFGSKDYHRKHTGVWLCDACSGCIAAAKKGPRVL